MICSNLKFTLCSFAITSAAAQKVIIDENVVGESNCFSRIFFIYENVFIVKVKPSGKWF